MKILLNGEPVDLLQMRRKDRDHITLILDVVLEVDVPRDLAIDGDEPEFNITGAEERTHNGAVWRIRSKGAQRE